MHYVYVIQSKKDGKWYTGLTEDLRKRFNEHNSGKVFSTKNRGSFKLIYYEACLNRYDAGERESYLKSGMGKRYIKNRLKRFLSVTGFTLAELMIAAAILVVVLAGLLAVFINCILLNELNRNLTLAYNAIQTKMEEIKNTGFPNLDALNDEPNFDLVGFSPADGQGRITVSDEGSTRLKRITIRACFMSRRRLIGDDINNCQSSPVELITLISE